MSNDYQTPSKTTKPLAIIPAAGFGTRMGSQKAKELATHPVWKKPFIEVALEICKEFQLHPHIVTRHEKIELIEWIKAHAPEAVIQTVLPTTEWPETVLQSKPYWQKKNVLLLPDTEFSPRSILRDMLNVLDVSESVWAVFREENLKLWGSIDNKKGILHVADKPETWSEHAKAWGLIGFRDGVGEEIFSNILHSYFTKEWMPLHCSSKVLELGMFQDLTR